MGPRRKGCGGGIEKPPADPHRWMPPELRRGMPARRTPKPRRPEGGGSIAPPAGLPPTRSHRVGHAVRRGRGCGGAPPEGMWRRHRETPCRPHRWMPPELRRGMPARRTPKPRRPEGGGSIVHSPPPHPLASSRPRSATRPGGAVGPRRKGCGGGIEKPRAGPADGSRRSSGAACAPEGLRRRAVLKAGAPSRPPAGFPGPPGSRQPATRQPDNRQTSRPTRSSPSASHLPVQSHPPHPAPPPRGQTRCACHRATASPRA